jgi:hypothetical protein
VCKRFPVAPAHEEKAGVRGQAKRLFPEAMKVEVHQTLPLGRQALCKPHPMAGGFLLRVQQKKGKKQERTGYSPNLYHI